MKLKMRYKLHCHLIFLCIFIIFTNTPMTTRAYRSTGTNALIDYPFYDMEMTAPFPSKRSISCDSCGNECSSACGTKNFRTCCFNYLRKRNDPNAMKSISNKRLIDFILLQGRAAMYTLDEHHRSAGGGGGGGGDEGRGAGVDAGIDGDEQTFSATNNGRRFGSAHFHHRTV
ncbi:uncharacterized protein LOC118738809 [Rhagoletis pomonella]|uniref:uncharacterized protein LOC118738809 n=1 Tax=Rhagoletis pomonella TaxID=28610 RepID=UPI00177EEFD9|nr:uncharacterized protein LOC118738809 [Rhagoletis pomonella]XP_036325702.1 uncharacterized protein LOC118738809 [Rhagoletis pomonella]